jgi:hypothetical protein
MPQYIALPRATSAPFEIIEVALANGLKTMLQVKPVTKDCVICAWGISSDGNAAGAPFPVELIDCDVAATVTSLTPDLWRNNAGAASLAVGGTSATGYNASVEGTLAAIRILDSVELRPDGDKYVMWFPLQERPKALAGRFVRIRTHATITTVNVIPWIIFDDE